MTESAERLDWIELYAKAHHANVFTAETVLGLIARIRELESRVPVSADAAIAAWNRRAPAEVGVLEWLKIKTIRKDLLYVEIEGMAAAEVSTLSHEPVEMLLASIAEALAAAPASPKESVAWRQGYEAGIAKGQKDQAVHERHYLAGWRAAEAKLAEGWKLVPVEPTYKMMKAADEINDRRMQWNGDGATNSEIYRAMLAAAPLPKQENE